jgi:hypothetical protein
MFFDESWTFCSWCSLTLLLFVTIIISTEAPSKSRGTTPLSLTLMNCCVFWRRKDIGVSAVGTKGRCIACPRSSFLVVRLTSHLLRRATGDGRRGKGATFSTCVIRMDINPNRENPKRAPSALTTTSSPPIIFSPSLLMIREESSSVRL